MTILLLLPGLAAVIGAGVAAVVAHHLRPSEAARLLVVTAAFTMLAVVWVLVGSAVLAAASVPVVAHHFGWCRDVVHDHPAAVLAGWGAVVALGLMATKGVRSAVRLGSGQPRPWPAAIQVVPTEAPTAFALPGRPGRPGRIVVSTGMLRVLDQQERRVLFAHEQSHLDHGHHRYLVVAAIASAVLPPLEPLLAQLRHALERWADEDAAAFLGDRRLVARAIARAALAQDASTPPMALAMATVGVRARVDALLLPSRNGPWSSRAALVIAGFALAMSVAGSALQLQHLIGFAAHICPL